MPEKTAPQPLHSVIAVICDALTDLSPDDRIRALEGVHVALGIPAKVVVTQVPPAGSPLDNYPPGLMPSPNGPTARPQPPTSRGRGAPQLGADPAYDTERAVNPWPRRGTFGNTPIA